MLRILDKGNLTLDLEKFGIEPRAERELMEAVSNPYGMVLVTGPTGSGKTTTLYSALRELNDISSKLITAEDPVEYDIDGIIQCQINSSYELTFGKILRSMLRQDPDTILVGEVRDKETAEIAIHASLTGHLVLSTIHTNDAAGAVTRLVEMEIEPFLVRSSVIGILAQRLVRILCQQCKVPYRPTEYELLQLGLDPERLARKARRKFSTRYAVHGKSYEFVGETMGEPVFHKPGGCDACMGKGFIGRRGIYELMVIDDAVGPLILKSADAQTIKRMAMSQGMDTLRDDGARKVLMGLTTVEEVLAASQEDVIIDE